MIRYVSVMVEEGVALVTLDAPDEKVNVLSEPFLLELEATAKELAARNDLKAAVVHSAKEAGFIAGADISAIADVDDVDTGRDLARQGQRIFNRWAALPFPVVAAVHGHCIGGGTEFALACSARVVAENVSFALPEVRLGILPGFGGTQRLPRLIPLEAALDIILTGRTVKADHARRIGLADRVVPISELVAQAGALARELATKPTLLQPARTKVRGGLRRLLLEKNPIGRLLVYRMAARNIARQTKGHYPAPTAALAVMRDTFAMSLERGLEREAQVLGQLIVTDVCKNLVHIFFLSQRAKKRNAPAAARPVQQAAILGAGVMGSAIAWLFASKSVPVLLKDIRQEVVSAGMERIRNLFSKKAGDRPETVERVASQMALVTGTIDLEKMADADLVIEAVIEKMQVKQTVLKETEARLKKTAIFATNTSALSVSELQQVAARPENVGGMHFFNPVDRMPLVEIIRGRHTSGTTVATLFDLALRLGKTPILVADGPGFLVNRLLMAYLNEACLMAEEGVDWQSLDHLTTNFGLPMGPFRLIDEVGIDIAVEVGNTISSAFSYLKRCRLLEQLNKAGLLGKKGGSGFYLYRSKKETPANPVANRVLKLSGGRLATENDLRRLLLLMVNEAGRCLDEQVVATPEDIDTGMVFGIGFPPFRGGLCRWADHQGRPALVLELRQLAEIHGERFVPCANLENNAGFYPVKTK